MRPLARWSLRLAACLLALPAAAATITDHALARPEGPRHYIALEPHGKPATKRPVLILIHGHGASAAMMVGLAGFHGFKSPAWAKLAERENILLIAPDGLKASDGYQAWNDCRGDSTTNGTNDDVGFIAALIDAAIARHGGDPERVYVYGASNGGTMAYRVGIELGGRVAAIGAQSALMPARSSCPAPSRPLSVFISHGTADPVAPYEGGKVGSIINRGRGSGLSAEESTAIWRKLANLNEPPSEYRFPHLHAEDKTSATRYVWGKDPTGIQVEFLRIDGGGHSEASTDLELPWLLRKFVGEMNHDLDTPEEVWAFFRNKKRPAPPP